MAALVREFMGTRYDISRYEKEFPEEVRKRREPKAEFLRFEWMFIGNMKEDDPRLENIGVRANQNSETWTVE